ncbi:hypothetical protein KAJ89_00785 [Candidatus Parcubacteria bacterium]|nr:hypothetical protein [Candidatus Parcubacteria bacterium]
MNKKSILTMLIYYVLAGISFLFENFLSDFGYLLFYYLILFLVFFVIYIRTLKKQKHKFLFTILYLIPLLSIVIYMYIGFATTFHPGF